MALFSFGKVKDLLKVGKKFNNKDFLKAVVGMSVAVAYADGDCDDAEIITMTELMKADESLSAFSESDIDTSIEKISKSFSINAMVGNLTVGKSVKALAGEDQKEMAMAIALAVAGADGNVDKDEIRVLKGFAKDMGISTSKFGI